MAEDRNQLEVVVGRNPLVAEEGSYQLESADSRNRLEAAEDWK